MTDNIAAQPKLAHAVLIGLNFLPYESTGDKNYWVNMISHLSNNLRRITIFSITSNHGPSEIHMRGCTINIVYIKPKILGSPSDSKKRMALWKGGRFPAIFGIVEKTLNTGTLIKLLNNLNKEHPYQCVHLMDNMGFVNRILSSRLKCITTVSAMAYIGRKPRFIYETYLRLSYKSKNLLVVPYSNAFATKLIKIGIHKTNIKRIPWGIAIHDTSKTALKEKRDAKKMLGLPIDMPLVLWAGYIQQIGRKDFLFSYDVAKHCLLNNTRSTFFFAFKPESYEKDFVAMHAPHDGIHVTKTNVEKFRLLKTAADIFLSPVTNMDSILAPPLTWIEMMGNGTPIITTPTEGANEIIDNGKNGVIADIKHFHSELNYMLRNYAKMQEKCRIKILRDFNITHSADSYLKLWGKHEYEI